MSKKIPFLAKTIVSLEPEQFDRALQLGGGWRTYINGLALFAVADFFQERAADLAVNLEKCSLFQPELARVIDAACNLQVGQFKICAIASGFAEEFLTLPRAAVDLPEFVAHFYIAVEVEEESAIAALQGFWRYDQLVQGQLEAQADWTYTLPMAGINPKLDDLLLHLRLLAPETIQLPKTAGDSPVEALRDRSSVLWRLPAIAERPLWQVLTWEEGAALLTNPALIRQLYRTKTTLINLSAWLQNSFEEGLQTVGTLFGGPEPEPPLAFRDEGGMDFSRGVKRALDLGVPVVVSVLREPGINLSAGSTEIASATESRIHIRVRAYPSPGEAYLPSGLRLKVFDESGEPVADEEGKPLAVEARQQDNWIHIFLYGVAGERFRIRVERDNASFSQDFVI